MKIAVIGAGMLGASTAYHLALAGHQVIVFDEGHPGKATLAGAGIVCPWATKADDESWYALYAAGARYYDQLIADLTARGESQVGYRKVGALVVADDPAEFDAAAERLSRRTAAAPESGGFQEISPEQARDHFPPLREDMKALFVPGGARVDARLLSAAMLRAAVAAGAELRSDLATLQLLNGRAILRDGRDQDVAVDQIVVAAGAWASRILAPLGLNHPVVPQRGQIVHLSLPGVDTSRWAVLLPMASHYLLAFDDSRVVIGATRENGTGFDYRVTAAGQHEVLSAGLHFAPGLANATILETRVGFRPAGPSITPILGRVKGIEGLVIGNGLGASGLTIGPLAGKLLASIATGEDPGFDLTPYTPTRG